MFQLSRKWIGMWTHPQLKLWWISLIYKWGIENWWSGLLNNFYAYSWQVLSLFLDRIQFPMYVHSAIKYLKDLHFPTFTQLSQGNLTSIFFLMHLTRTCFHPPLSFFLVMHQCKWKIFRAEIKFLWTSLCMENVLLNANAFNMAILPSSLKCSAAAVCRECMCSVSCISYPRSLSHYDVLTVYIAIWW